MKRNIERFPSKQMYPYLSLVERKVAEFYYNIDRRSWLVWVKMTYFHRFFGTIPGVLTILIWLCCSLVYCQSSLIFIAAHCSYKPNLPHPTFCMLNLKTIVDHCPQNFENHRKTIGSNGWTPKKTFNGDGPTLSKPLKNHWRQWWPKKKH